MEFQSQLKAFFIFGWRRHRVSPDCRQASFSVAGCVNLTFFNTMLRELAQR